MAYRIIIERGYKIIMKKMMHVQYIIDKMLAFYFPEMVSTCWSNHSDNMFFSNWGRFFL